MIDKLHLGAGKCYLPGFLNIDIFSSVKADAYYNMTALPYPTEYFSCIYASHCLEHIQRHMVLATLAHWHSLLKKGGVLRVAVPNFKAVCERYLEKENLAEVTGFMVGGQNHPLNVHTVIFDEKMLTDCLIRAGFSHVHWWDWRTTEHAQYDDYSRAMLPHMDFDNGKLMSLNLEAIKL